MSATEPTPDLVPLQVVVEFFNAEAWPIRQVGEQSVLQTAFQGQNGAWLCYANCRSEFGQMLFYSIAPSVCRKPHERRWQSS